MGSCYKIYAVYDKGKWIGSYTTDAVEKLLGIPKNQVPIYANDRGKQARGRYTFQLDSSENWGEEFKKEWDKSRLKLLNTGRRAHGSNGRKQA